MDLEIVLINNIHIPYLLTWFDGSITKISFNDLIDLLVKDSNIKANQEKWYLYGDLSLGKISIKNQIYTLKVTGNKRELI